MENITVDWQYEYIVHAYFSKGGLTVRVSAPNKLVSRPRWGGGYYLIWATYIDMCGPKGTCIMIFQLFWSQIGY